MLSYISELRRSVDGLLQDILIAVWQLPGVAPSTVTGRPLRPAWGHQFDQLSTDYNAYESGTSRIGIAMTADWLLPQLIDYLIMDVYTACLTSKTSF